MRPPRNSSLYALLIVVAVARLSMQMVAMPPYAGLDELFHVARLEFVFQEHRNPTTTERSIPPYLDATLHRNPAGVSSFAVWQKDWRELIPTCLGLTSPDHPSLLFRWGPPHLPPAWTVPFRFVQAAALVVMVRRA